MLYRDQAWLLRARPRAQPALYLASSWRRSNCLFSRDSREEELENGAYLISSTACNASNRRLHYTCSRVDVGLES
jgi:hypothetical protein